MRPVSASDPAGADKRTDGKQAEAAKPEPEVKIGVSREYRGLIVDLACPVVVDPLSCLWYSK